MNFEINFTENALEDVQEITTLEHIMSSVEKLKTFPIHHAAENSKI